MGEESTSSGAGNNAKVGASNGMKEFLRKHAYGEATTASLDLTAKDTQQQDQYDRERSGIKSNSPSNVGDANSKISHMKHERAAMTASPMATRSNNQMTPTGGKE